MQQRRASRIRAIARAQERDTRFLHGALALLVTGLVIGQLLLLTSP